MRVTCLYARKRHATIELDGHTGAEQRQYTSAGHVSLPLQQASPRNFCIQDTNDWFGYRFVSAKSWIVQESHHLQLPPQPTASVPGAATAQQQQTRSHALCVCSRKPLETRGQCECGRTHVSRCCAAQMIEKTICAPGQPLAFALHGPVPPTREGTLRRHQHPESE